ncbi:Uu.00g136820.m01.CDS01 [Anthostomella pinea]|uniref:Uu.00g136820.m01.CDS01 n=1 Tax=Anthostomella pinea TaxID=933095 RepID=A0AAI8YL10_9PEZI|nr:Uu.00g136820.m01.CDS01 [Anthostomella pinea]
MVVCRVTDNILYCDGDNRGYARPTEADNWGCNTGPFAILEEDNAVHQPSANRRLYYTENPTNHYSRMQTF